jgi:acetyltransferase
VNAAAAYPADLATTAALADGTAITIRPIRPEDARIEQEFVRNLSDESRYFRFMDTLRELSPRMLAELTQVDYDSHMALIAVAVIDGRETEIAVARYVVADDGRSCEFAIVVADAWQRRGVATALMEALMQAARRRGLALMYGEVLASNHRMLHFVRRLGFDVIARPDDPRTVRVEKAL